MMIQNAGALLRGARRCFSCVNFFFCDIDCLVSGDVHCRAVAGRGAGLRGIFKV